MKKMKLLSNLFLLAAFVLIVPSSLYAQTNSVFDTKEHKDTTVIIPGKVPLRTAKGQQHFSDRQRNADLRPNLNAMLPAEKTIRSKNTIVTSQETGLPVFITTPSTQRNAAVRKAAPQDKKTACFTYLKELSSALKIEKPEQEFEIQTIETETNGKSHIRLQQHYKGIRIYGAESIVHLNAAGLGEAFNGHYTLIDKKKIIDLKPVLDAKDAIELVIGDVSKKTHYRTLNAVQKKYLDYEGPELDTVLYEDKTLVKSYLLTYHISIHPNFIEHWEYLVDAKTGRILESYKNSCHVDGPRTATATDLNGTSQTIDTYQKGSNYLLQDYSRSMFNSTDTTGLIVTMDANFTYGDNFSVQEIVSTNNTDWGTIAVSAHHNAGVAFQYYKTAHGRNSIDGKGGTIYSFINVTDPETGEAFDNAFWNNKFMYYGNGITAFKPLAGGLDVGGHEMTHGVVQNTANLRYQGESGAINESMADIFGFMMDSTNWTIGETVVKLSAFPSGALRSLSDPHNGGTSLSNPGYQPRHVNEKYTGAQDNGGVHINSGIPNWAFYKFATALGSRAKAASIYYRALTTYLTPSSQFIDLRLAIIKSSEDLYGTGSNEATQAGAAFDAVGIVNGSGTGTANNTLQVNPGSDYLLSYDDQTDGLLRCTPAGTDFAILMDKTLFSKPSVADNGTTCVYVGTDNRIYRINVDPNQSINKSVLHSSPIWANAAISKDGKRLAAVTLAQDTSIYVFDINSSQAVRFQLYNPTFTQGVKSAGPIHADAIEWDYSGEYLIYDCYNKISTSGQSDITYWDINLINVWDNASNTFSDGEIIKLFNNLGESESIGNPAFSKNSPEVIAFDYENSSTGDIAIFGMNLEENSLAVIAINNYLGWPSFNKTDTRVAYTGEDGGALNIYYVELNADKISSTGVENGLVGNAMWPVYYAVGTRSLSTAVQKSEAVSSSVKLYPNPAKNELYISFPKVVTGNIELQIVNQLGQTVAQQSFASLNGDVIQLNISELPSGIYSLQIKGNEYASTQKFIRQDSGR